MEVKSVNEVTNKRRKLAKQVAQHIKGIVDEAIYLMIWFADKSHGKVQKVQTTGARQDLLKLRTLSMKFEIFKPSSQMFSAYTS